MKEIEIQIMKKQMKKHMMLILNYMLSNEYTVHSKKTASCTPDLKKKCYAKINCAIVYWDS